MQNSQFFIFRTGKSIISLPPVPPTKIYISVNQCYIFLGIFFWVVDGVHKKSFFGFQK